MKLLECVPNFSAARDKSTVAALIKCAANAPCVKLINSHTDSDHNRTVLTLIGEPQPLQTAMVQLATLATELIDLTKHKGCHPRIGAVDVIPFIPLKNSDMGDAIQSAVSLGNEIGSRLKIPVFLYGEAARIPAHRKLATIRRGGYEMLRTTIGTEIRTTPDFGPSILSTAGATAVGARFFLIAFNIFLNTDNLSIAKNIAEAIRESSGGMQHVQALGMIANEKAQVSMNLMDYRVTSLRDVFGAVASLAEKQGVTISHSELVGCLPQAALTKTNPTDLKIHNFSETLILENHLH